MVTVVRSASIWSTSVQSPLLLSWRSLVQGGDVGPVDCGAVVTSRSSPLCTVDFVKELVPESPTLCCEVAVSGGGVRVPVAGVDDGISSSSLDDVMNWLSSSRGSYSVSVRTVRGASGTSPGRSSPEEETVYSSGDGRYDEYSIGMSVKKGSVKLYASLTSIVLSCKSPLVTDSEVNTELSVVEVGTPEVNAELSVVAAATSEAAADGKSTLSDVANSEPKVGSPE